MGPEERGPGRGEGLRGQGEREGARAAGGGAGGEGELAGVRTAEGLGPRALLDRAEPAAAGSSESLPGAHRLNLAPFLHRGYI